MIAPGMAIQKMPTREVPEANFIGNFSKELMRGIITKPPPKPTYPPAKPAIRPMATERKKSLGVNLKSLTIGEADTTLVGEPAVVRVSGEGVAPVVVVVLAVCAAVGVVVPVVRVVDAKVVAFVADVAGLFGAFPLFIALYKVDPAE